MKTHREEIARIIHPWAFNGAVAWSQAHKDQCRAEALAKADQIIAAWNRRADPLVEELRGALRQAEDWFREYADLHRAKCSADGDAKARTNTERADFCAREALALPVGNIAVTSGEPAASTPAPPLPE